VSVHKWRLSAPAGVLAHWKSSTQPSYACGSQITAVLAATKIYHLWMDTNQPGCAWRQERREWLMKRIRLLTTLLLLAGIAALAAPSARADSPLSEIIFYVH